MGLFAMEISLHVCANGHIVPSMNPGLFRNGKHPLTLLMRHLHWGLQMYLYMSLKVLSDCFLRSTKESLFLL